MKRVADLRSLKNEELSNKMIEVEKELLIERSRKGSGGRAFNAGKIRNLKIMYATIKTLLRERNL